MGGCGEAPKESRLTNNGQYDDVSDTTSSWQLQRGREQQPCDGEAERDLYQWPTEPPVCGADDVIPRRVDRIKCLGNAVHVPTAKEAFKRLMGI